MGTGAVARILGVSPPTVRTMLERGELLGERGGQPRRPRWRVAVDDLGRVVASDGTPVRPQPGGAAVSALAALEERVAALEAHPEQAHERLREAALLLNATVERQREAAALQSKANEILSQTVAEQAQIISTLLVPDAPPAERSSVNPRPR